MNKSILTTYHYEYEFPWKAQCVERLSAPALAPGIDFSDNRNFWKFGYPALMMTDTALYRNPNYHLPTDTIDTLDFDKIAEVVKAVTWTLLRMTS
jgi:hypothetical protein